MKCSTLDCHSEAVAVGVTSGKYKCNICALKIMAMSGPSAVKTLPDAKFPWDYPADDYCRSCGVQYNKYQIGHTGDCPMCRKDIPLYKGAKND
jgi:rubredoxin